MEKNLIQIIEEAVKSDTMSVANAILSFLKRQSDQPTNFTYSQEIKFLFGKHEEKDFKVTVNNEGIFAREWNKKYAKKIVAGALPYINKGVGINVEAYSNVYADYEEIRIVIPPLVSL